MKKFKVIYVNTLTTIETGLKVGDIVTFMKKENGYNIYKLPKHLFGRGHNGGGRYKVFNYWCLRDVNVKEVIS